MMYNMYIDIKKKCLGAFQVCRPPANAVAHASKKNRKKEEKKVYRYKEKNVLGRFKSTQN